MGSFPETYNDPISGCAHCCANNVGSCCMRVGSGAQTDATTPNNVGTCSALWEGYNP